MLAGAIGQTFEREGPFVTQLSDWTKGDTRTQGEGKWCAQGHTARAEPRLDPRTAVCIMQLHRVAAKRSAVVRAEDK